MCLVMYKFDGVNCAYYTLGRVRLFVHLLCSIKARKYLWVIKR